MGCITELDDGLLTGLKLEAWSAYVYTFPVRMDANLADHFSGALCSSIQRNFGMSSHSQVVTAYRRHPCSV